MGVSNTDNRLKKSVDTLPATSSSLNTKKYIKIGWKINIWNFGPFQTFSWNQIAIFLWPINNPSKTALKLDEKQIKCYPEWTQHIAWHSKLLDTQKYTGNSNLLDLLYFVHLSCHLKLDGKEKSIYLSYMQNFKNLVSLLDLFSKENGQFFNSPLI